MRKMSTITLAAVVFLACAGLVSAQVMPKHPAEAASSQQDKTTQEQGTMMQAPQGTMMGGAQGGQGRMMMRFHKGMYGGSKMWMMRDRGMKGMASMIMMPAMMKPTMVASGDGGVIVLSGMTLSKYDKNLNLVKQTQIKVNVAAMQDMMQKMQSTCAICPFTKCKGMMKAPAQQSTPVKPVPPMKAK